MAFILNSGNFSTSFFQAFDDYLVTYRHAQGSLELTALHVYLICIQLIATEHKVGNEHHVGERQKPQWSFEKHISTNKKKEPRRVTKKEKCLIKNQAQMKD